MLTQLNPLGLAYIHLMEPNETDLNHGAMIQHVLSTFHGVYAGTIITNGGYGKASGDEVLARQTADLVSFGRPFIANPQLPQRFATDAELNTPDVATFYGIGDANLEKGYTDYPALTSA